MKIATIKGNRIIRHDQSPYKVRLQMGHRLYKTVDVQASNINDAYQKSLKQYPCSVIIDIN